MNLLSTRTLPRILRLRVLLLTLACLAPLASGASASTPHTDPASGLTVSLPDGWAARPGEGGPSVELASDERFFTTKNAAGVATAMIYTSKKAEFGGPKDPKQLADYFAERMANGGKVESSSATQPIDIGGHPGAMKKIRGKLSGQNGEFTFAAVVATDDLAILIGMDTTGGDLGAAVDAVARSMRFADAGSAAAAAEPAADVSPEETEARMKDFLAAFQGDSSAIAAAFERHAAANVDDPDAIGAFNLASPEIVGNEEVDGKTCYSVKTKAGVTIRTWSVCWRGGKIQTVEQTKMEFAGR